MALWKCGLPVLLLSALVLHEPARKFLHLMVDTMLRMDMPAFVAEHKRLYAAAEQDGNFTPVTLHYYSQHARSIKLFIGNYWHFYPEDPALSREENFDALNGRFQAHLGLEPGQRLCELGCGFCRTGREVARLSGARFVGVTLAPEEVAMGNAEIRELGLQDRAEIIQGDYTAVPLEAGSCDGVLAVYTLKYSTPTGKLPRAFREVSRLLRPGGRFVSYEILTTDSYDEGNARHAEWSRRISYHTGMPPLASVHHFRAPEPSLRLLQEEDLEEQKGHRRTVDSFPLTLEAHRMQPLCDLAEKLRLKRGVSEYCDHFLIHPFVDFLESMSAGVVTGSRIFSYERV